MSNAAMRASAWPKVFAMNEKRSEAELAGHDPLLHDALSQREAPTPSSSSEPPPETPVLPTPFRFQVRTVPPGWLQNAIGVLRRATPAGGIANVKRDTVRGLGKDAFTPTPEPPAAFDDPQRNIETAPVPVLKRRARQRKQLAVAGAIALVVLAVAVWLAPSKRTAEPSSPSTTSQPAAALASPEPQLQPSEPQPNPVPPPRSEPTVAAPASDAPSATATAATAPEPAPPRATARSSEAKPRASSAARPPKSRDPDRPFF